MDGSKILWRIPSLHDHSLDPRAAIVLDLVPRASAHQADEARLLNSGKISKIEFWKNFQNWQKVPQKPQFWDQFDVCPLWTAITWTLEVQLTWILSLWTHGQTTSRAWWWPQKTAQKWYFWAFFYEMASLFWFSLFLLPLSGFWPFSFPLGGVKNIQTIFFGTGEDVCFSALRSQLVQWGCVQCTATVLGVYSPITSVSVSYPEHCNRETPATSTLAMLPAIATSLMTSKHFFISNIFLWVISLKTSIRPATLRTAHSTNKTAVRILHYTPPLLITQTTWA